MPGSDLSVYEFATYNTNCSSKFLSLLDFPVFEFATPYTHRRTTFSWGFLFSLPGTLRPTFRTTPSLHAGQKGFIVIKEQMFGQKTSSYSFPSKLTLAFHAGIFHTRLIITSSGNLKL